MSSRAPGSPGEDAGPLGAGREPWRGRELPVLSGALPAHCFEVRHGNGVGLTGDLKELVAVHWRRHAAAARRLARYRRQRALASSHSNPTDARMATGICSELPKYGRIRFRLTSTLSWWRLRMVLTRMAGSVPEGAG